MSSSDTFNPAGENCSVCQPSCGDKPFERVFVSYILAGMTTVSFTLLPAFQAPMPYSAQLQVGQSQNPLADDWINVGMPAVNAYTMVDPEQRIQGKLRYQFYRIILTDGNGQQYTSLPVGLSGTLSPRDWRIARERLRQERVRMRMVAGQEGYLLKRRITGTPCPTCLDYTTEEVGNPHCPSCYGTGFLCGYFFPISCVWADIDPATYHLNLDSSRGTVTDIVVKARMANTWIAGEDDIWVNRKTDDRYYLHKVQNVIEVRGVPLIANIEMRPAPASDPVYTIEIPDQLASLPYDGQQTQRLL